jgi:acetylornithine/N-succinyldiaminopimelate aminotransferase
MTATTAPPTATTGSTTASNADIIAAHDAHLSINYARFPVAMVRGKGSELWDADGKRYIDLFTGFGATVVGHCHPTLVEAVTRQAGLLWHAGNQFHTQPQTRLAAAIARHGFGGRSFFCHSGADANEAAIKLARLYGGAKPGKNGQRFRVISATKSFHGRTIGTMPATGNEKVREGFGPLPPGYVNVAYDDIDAVRNAIDDDTVAVIVEPIQGEGGINVPDPSYFPSLRALCDERDLLLIADEVWTGCARTGRYFGHQLWGVEPDIMTLGKGVGGGLAVGVMCARPPIAELYDARKAGITRHATTLGGNCIAMAAADAVFEVIERDNLCQRAETLGQRVIDRLTTFSRSHGFVTDIRGRGLFLGVELDPSRGAWFKAAPEASARALQRGLVINATQGNVLRIAPAVTIEDAILDEGLSVLEEVLAG